MVSVEPVARTQVDWQKFLLVAKQLLGRSVTASLDARNQPVGDPASWLASLAELRQEGSDPVAVLRSPGSLLRHLSYSFLVVADREFLYELATSCDLRIEGDQQLAVVSGSVEQWRTTIVNGSTGRESRDMRMFCDKCLLHFERDGLGLLWSSYQKSLTPDGTFKLLEK